MKSYSILKAIFGAPMRLLFRVHLHGEENLPESGGLIVCPNHISASDVIFLTAATSKRQLRYMAKAELFKIPLLNLIIKGFGAFPVKRGAGDVRAIKTTIELLQKGEVVGLFPQGTRYKGVEPKTSSVKEGVGLMAYKSGVDVIPVAIKTKGYKVCPIFKRVDVTYGKLIKNSELGFTKGGKEEFKAASEYIFEKMLELHDIEYK